MALCKALRIEILLLVDADEPESEILENLETFLVQDLCHREAVASVKERMGRLEVIPHTDIEA